MSSYESTTIVLPVMNETYSLRQTVKVIRQSSEKDVKEYLTVVCDQTNKESLAV
jgi:hypothetical protein